MSITRGDFLRSLGKSLPGLVASTGMVTAAEALIRRVAQAAPPPPVSKPAEPSSPSISFFEHGGAEGNQLALTFDDGPVPGITERILDELKKRDLPATFFMIGRQVAAAPDLARRVLAEGHEIGNHTFTHRKLTELPDDEALEELEKTEAIFREAIDYKAAWFRPPFGAFRRAQAPMATARNLGVALWNVDSEDWQNPGEARIAENILTKSQPGSILLCHELSQTADCLGFTLDQLLARSLQFVTVSTLFQSAGSIR
jgi:peptidoglycan/xylan/chitin deacetylase (PgdA/CDA1 family)